jgi:hypothetical protein
LSACTKPLFGSFGVYCENRHAFFSIGAWVIKADFFDNGSVPTGAAIYDDDAVDRFFLSTNTL